MTKAEVVSDIKDRIAREGGLEYEIENTEITAIIDAFFETVKDAVTKGESIELRGFGTFKHKVRAAKVARNPRTNQPVNMQKHAIPYFKPGIQFKDMLKNLKV